MIQARSIHVGAHGRISVDGNDGVSSAESLCATIGGKGSGGGAGGGLVIAARSVTVDGGGIVSARGGTGGQSESGGAGGGGGGVVKRHVPIWSGANPVVSGGAGGSNACDDEKPAGSAGNPGKVIEGDKAWSAPIGPAEEWFSYTAHPEGLKLPFQTVVGDVHAAGYEVVAVIAA